MRYVLALVLALWPLPGFLLRGTRRSRGSHKPSAYTRMKELGTPSATSWAYQLTEADFNSLSPRGKALAAWEHRHWRSVARLRESNSFVRGWSGYVTDVRGVNGEHDHSADCDERMKQ